MAADPTLIQARTYLGSITFTGNDYLASYANGGGVDRGRSEGECVDFYKRRMGQGLKGQLEVVRAENKPTEVFLVSVSPITPNAFAPFLEYAVTPGGGFSYYEGGNSILSWANVAQKPGNLFYQGDENKAPTSSAVGMAVIGVKGDINTAAILGTNYALPSNIALFIGFYITGVDTGGTIWSATKADYVESSNPDLALYIDIGATPTLKLYSAALGSSVSIATATEDTLYVMCVQRTTDGEVNVYMHGTSSPAASDSGAYPAGDRGGMSILDGYSTVGPSDVTIGSIMVVSRNVSAAERTAQLASIYQALHVIA